MLSSLAIIRHSSKIKFSLLKGALVLLTRLLKLKHKPYNISKHNYKDSRIMDCKRNKYFKINKQANLCRGTLVILKWAMICNLEWLINHLCKHKTNQQQALQLSDSIIWQTTKTKILSQVSKLFSQLAIPYFNNSHLLKIPIFLEVNPLQLKHQALEQLNRTILSLNLSDQLQTLEGKALVKYLEI